ncbi:MAG: hypothetical protein WDN72_10735 [Alphaproteobacteria bacterium]
MARRPAQPVLRGERDAEWQHASGKQDETFLADKGHAAFPPRARQMSSAACAG